MGNLSAIASLAVLAAAPATATAVPDPVYGVLALGPTLIALPLDELREVVPCPEAFGGLPAAMPGLIGAVGLRGKVLPVLDLRVVLQMPTARHENQVVVVVRHGGRGLGLLVDGVSGLARPPAASVHSMVSGGDDLLFSGSFERAETGRVVSLLDVGAIMRLPGLPLLRDADADVDAEVAGRHSGAAAVERRALMLVRCGDLGLAIEVEEIHATLPEVTLLPSSMDGRICKGLIEHAGVRLAAVDPLALAQLGNLPPGTPCQALLLRYPQGLVALLVTRVVDIVRVPVKDLQALPPLVVRRPELFCAVVHVPNRGEHLVLGMGALHEDADMRGFAALNTVLAAQREATGVAATRRSAVITYDAGFKVASRLVQVSEVLPMPHEHARPTSAHAAVIGLFTHRGHGVTLVCLSRLLGGESPPASADARLLLVDHRDAHFAFVVPRLYHIENTVWEQPVREGAGSQSAGVDHPCLRQHAMVEVENGVHRSTLHLVDLHRCADLLLDATPLDGTACVAEAAGAESGQNGCDPAGSAVPKMSVGAAVAAAIAAAELAAAASR